ncbi:MAG: SEL1-like repeat protein [Elusimicrobia bacterium]|nr:SEL1-like repeat protein [Elusimicrobiota bacterium]
MALTALLGLALAAAFSLVLTGRFLVPLQWLSGHIGAGPALGAWGFGMFLLCVGVPVRLAFTNLGTDRSRKFAAALVLWNGLLTGAAAYMSEESLWQSGKNALAFKAPRPTGSREAPNRPAVYPKTSLPGAAERPAAFGWKEPEKAVAGKDADTGLGQWMLLGQGSVIGAPDFPERWKKIEDGAQNGKPEDRLKLGAYLCNGVIVKRDGPSGLYWMGRAAREGSVEAMYQLGRLYRHGRDCAPESHEAAAAWLHEAAEKKHVPAMRELAFLVLNGLGMPASRDGLDWLKKAAETGDMQAMSDLGSLYNNGNFVDKDKAEARIWFAKAAKLCGPYCYAQEQLDVIDGKRPAEYKSKAPDKPSDPNFDPAKMLLGFYAKTGNAMAAAEAAGKERAFAYWKDDLVGKAAPELQGETLDGRPVDLKQLKGKPVWLTFGATSCPGTQQQASGQGAWMKRIEGARFITVLSTKAEEAGASASEAKAFAKKHGFPADAIWLADRYTLKLGHGPTPRSILVDASGVVREVGGSLTEDAARAALASR